MKLFDEQTLLSEEKSFSGKGGAGASQPPSARETLLINEIFFSIQGEASYTGYPCVFVRLTGCNLRCSWCDTTYSFYEGKRENFDDILKKIGGYDCNLVEITGGEPLLQKAVFPFFDFLHTRRYKLLIETSGSISIEKVPDFVHIVMDLKPPGSGEADKNKIENLSLLKSSDDLKFVVSDENDFHWAEKVYLDHNLKEKLKKPAIIQPVSEESRSGLNSITRLNLINLAEAIKKSKASFRLGVQLHKYIYPPDQKGV